MPPTILLRGQDIALGALGPAVVLVTDGPHAWASNQVNSVVEELTRLRKTSHRERLIYVYVAGATTDIPDTAARKQSAPIAELFDECVGIHEGDGFRASLTRAIVTSISMFSATRVRPEIVASVSEAGARLSARLGQPATSIVDAIEAVRAAAHGK